MKTLPLGLVISVSKCLRRRKLVNIGQGHCHVTNSMYIQGSPHSHFLNLPSLLCLWTLLHHTEEEDQRCPRFPRQRLTLEQFDQSKIREKQIISI